MKKWYTSNYGEKLLFEARRTGDEHPGWPYEVVLAADAEAAIREAVAKEREEILARFGDVRAATVPASHLTILEDIIRARGEPGPLAKLPVWSGDEGIPKVGVGVDVPRLAIAINELVDAVNALRQKT